MLNEATQAADALASLKIPHVPAPANEWRGAADELLAHAERGEPGKAGHAVLELLKTASQIIRQAEDRISEQDMRIALLEGIATTDELTGLMNRRGFFDSFSRELDRVNRGQSENGLIILIDLDNFKPINDTYGHPAGDAALKLVGRTLGADIRKMDVAARLGGDEFVLLFANATREGAAARVQKLMWMLNNLSLVWYGTEIPVRASLGIKEFTKGDTIERIFSAADVQLYDAKRRSREGKMAEVFAAE